MDKVTNKQITNWNSIVKTKSIQQRLEFVFDKITGNKTFSTSFGIEDQVLTHMLYTHNKEFSIFTLDTGRQFEETYEVFQKTAIKYSNYTIKTYVPDENDVQMYVETKGINGFYDSIQNRKECCFVRKVKPLKRALMNVDVWITGLRSQQSTNRETMNFFEWDDDNKILKFNPILDFSLNQLEELVTQNNIPMNSLFKKGYVSIGCAPCTRAIESGEDFRAGRWWWENGKKECGLHSLQNNN